MYDLFKYIIILLGFSFVPEQLSSLDVLHSDCDSVLLPVDDTILTGDINDFAPSKVSISWKKILISKLLI